MSIAYAEVIGDPILHSKSPLIHKFWLEKLGVEGIYRATHVSRKELSPYLSSRRDDPDWRGCNVTIPHKIEIMSLVDRVEGIASAAGAVNVVVKEPSGQLVGHNSDVEGFLEPLIGQGSWRRSIHGSKVRIHVIGAGGAARAVGAAFQGEELTFFNRDVAKASRLAEEFANGTGTALPLAALAGPSYEAKDDGGQSYIVVNGSALGMRGQEALHINLGHYPDDTIVYDLVYDPLETDLLAQARRRGMRAIDGLHMLVGQAAVAFELFFGIPAPRAHDAELRTLLTS